MEDKEGDPAHLSATLNGQAVSLQEIFQSIDNDEAAGRALEWLMSERPRFADKLKAIQHESHSRKPPTQRFKIWNAKLLRISNRIDAAADRARKVQQEIVELEPPREEA